jgi:hypothetical protein
MAQHPPFPPVELRHRCTAEVGPSAAGVAHEPGTPAEAQQGTTLQGAACGRDMLQMIHFY